jgi:hypothetical protein
MQQRPIGGRAAKRGEPIKGLHLLMIMDPDLPDDAALGAQIERWLTGGTPT